MLVVLYGVCDKDDLLLDTLDFRTAEGSDTLDDVARNALEMNLI